MAAVPEARVQVEIAPFHPYLLRLYGISEAEFDALGNEDLKAEYVDGVMIVHSPASVSHEWRVAFLLTLMNLYVSEQGRGIAAFRWISPEALPEIARRLESLAAPWRGWGAFRAIGHRFVWEHHREHLLLRP